MQGQPARSMEGCPRTGFSNRDKHMQVFLRIPDFFAKLLNNNPTNDHNGKKEHRTTIDTVHRVLPRDQCICRMPGVEPFRKRACLIYFSDSGGTGNDVGVGAWPEVGRAWRPRQCQLPYKQYLRLSSVRRPGSDRVDSRHCSPSVKPTSSSQPSELQGQGVCA